MFVVHDARAFFVSFFLVDSEKRSGALSVDTGTCLVVSPLLSSESNQPLN